MLQASPQCVGQQASCRVHPDDLCSLNTRTGQAASQSAEWVSGVDTNRRRLTVVALRGAAALVHQNGCQLVLLQGWVLWHGGLAVRGRLGGGG